MERANRFLQSRRGRLVLAAGGMALILCAVYAACGFWPFGPNSVMTGDLNSQYIPFYAHFYDAVRGGGSLFYADDLGLGGGAFALFAYYFASPFAWLYLVIAPEFYGQLCCIVWALKVILAAADTFRAAAIEQLEVWAERSGCDLIRQSEGSDPASVVFDAISAAKARGADVVICDTAGRLHNKKNLMAELEKINRIIDRELPGAAKEVLLVLDAATGQNAVNQAREFQNAAHITGIVLTKLDGTPKGGVVIAIREDLKIPVKFIGVGEQLDDLQPFDADEFAKALFEH